MPRNLTIVDEHAGCSRSSAVNQEFVLRQLFEWGEISWAFIALQTHKVFGFLDDLETDLLPIELNQCQFDHQQSSPKHVSSQLSCTSFKGVIRNPNWIKVKVKPLNNILLQFVNEIWMFIKVTISRAFIALQAHSLWVSQRPRNRCVANWDKSMSIWSLTGIS